MHSEVQGVTNHIVNTTVGRVIFNNALPEGIPFVNGLLKKKGQQQLVQYCYLRYGLDKTVEMLDDLRSASVSCTRRAPASRLALMT